MSRDPVSEFNTDDDSDQESTPSTEDSNAIGDEAGSGNVPDSETSSEPGADQSDTGVDASTTASEDAAANLRNIFKGLEGLGQGLEETFAELDERVAEGRQYENRESGSSKDYSTIIPEIIRKLLSGSADVSVIDLGHFKTSGNYATFESSRGFTQFFDEITQMFQDERTWDVGINKQAHEIIKEMVEKSGPESNIDPADRINLEQLMRVAEMRVAATVGFISSPGQILKIEVVNRTQWAERTIDDYKKLFQALARSIASGISTDTDTEDDVTDDPVSALMSTLGRTLGPAMGGITAGTIVGRLAQRALGGYELPIPRPQSAPVLLVLPNVDEFCKQWELSRDDLQLYVCLKEVVYHTVFSVQHVRDHINNLLSRFVSTFDASLSRLEDMFDGIDSSEGPENILANIQHTMSNPGSLLNVMQSSSQETLQPKLTALTSVIQGYTHHVVDTVGSSLIGSYGRLNEAMRRHRAEMGSSDRFSERLLGLELDQTQHDRGLAFVEGVLKRAGEEGLQKLFEDSSHLPTPAEVDAPGLWLARIDLQ